ncbi:DUF5667 domain-containing protein [Actinokineospora sp.]|uniref:DUF5667 domain-containing protein n=1 Tax=Actinokineospora sp. TaxID=1872133 RepID=UPI0040381B31
MESGSGPSTPRGRRERSARVGRPQPRDPDLSADDRSADNLSADDRTVVELFAGLAPLTAPDPATRDRMRERILAGLAESADPTAPVLDRPRATRSPRAGRAPRTRSALAPGGTRPGEAPRTGSGARGRLVVASIAVLALVFSLAGMSLLLARDALPGDALYGVKRTGEAASLGLTFGDEDRAFKHLEFATARITEIETLTQRHPNPADAPIGSYLSALGDFDTDAAAGTRQLTALATSGDGSQLEILRTWANQQGDRLSALGPKLPSAASTRQAASVALLAKIERRSDALIARLPCYQITSGAVDDVGPMPATGVCEPRADGPRILPSNTEAGTRPAPTGPALTTPPQAQPTEAAPGQPALTPPGASAPPQTIVVLPPLLGGPNSTGPGGSTAPTITLPLPLPLPTIALPPLLPGLPGLLIS